MAIQQYRIVRLVMVLAIVGLTIFLYASYYANPTMSVPGRIHTASALLSEIGEDVAAIKVINGNEMDAAFASSQKGKVEMKKYFIQTADDVNGSYAQQYSDVFISASSSAQPNSSNSQLHASNVKQKESEISKNPNTQIQKTASNSSLIQAVPNNKIAPSQPYVAGHLDTSKGIRTDDLYESGHSEANIELCPDSGESLRLLILITSAPTHREARLAIRQTWGHYATRRDISIAFVLGATQMPSLEDALAAENYMYSDLIRGHFIDSYNNLTLKTISSLEWVDTYCPKVSFVLKTDDDMFINVPRLLVFIEKHHNDNKVIYGRLAKKWKPIRNKKSKYYVSPQQYFPPVFPQFTTGPAYLMTVDVVHGLYTKALNQTYLKLEDVFTTGIVAQLVNVKRIHVNEFLNRRIAFNPCNIRKAISVHMVKSNEQFDLWKKLLDTNTKCK